MTTFKNINSDLQARLKDSQDYPNDFLVNIALVYALQSYPVIAPSEPFYVKINDKNVIPVFTNESDWESFKEHIDNERLKWIEASIAPLLDSIAATEIEAVGFNIDIEKHRIDAEHTFFEKEAFTQFVRFYTELLNDYYAPENQEATKLDKLYFVPAFQGTDEDGLVRTFPFMTAGDEQQYAPVFDNLDSLAKWYRSEYFGEPFKKDQGTVLFWKLTEFGKPTEGRNILGDAVGVTINPTDVDISEYKKTIFPWNFLTKPDYDKK